MVGEARMQGLRDCRSMVMDRRWESTADSVDGDILIPCSLSMSAAWVAERERPRR